MACLSQFYVLSPRGDSIIFRDFRAEAPKSSPEVFFKHRQFYDSSLMPHCTESLLHYNAQAIETQNETSSSSHNNTSSNQSDVASHSANNPSNSNKSSIASSSCSVQSPPIFTLDNLTYLHLVKNGLYFVATTRINTSPSLILEWLTRLTRLFKDYLGVLSEESLRCNFTLVYELMDEIVDFGYIQTTQTEVIKERVHNEAIQVQNKSGQPSSGHSNTITGQAVISAVSSGKHLVSSVMSGSDSNTVVPQSSASKTTPSTSVDKPISLSNLDSSGGGMSGLHRPRPRAAVANEIFVDIYERLSCCFNSSGQLAAYGIDGAIQMKSYLSQNPELRLALNEDLVIASSNAGAVSSNHNLAGLGPVVLDDMNFHSCLNMSEWESQRILSFHPPDGEFVLVSYRLSQPDPSRVRPPFICTPLFEVVSPYKCELILRLDASGLEKEHYGGNIVLSCVVPRHTTSVSMEFLQPGSASGIKQLAGQTCEFDAKSRKIIWRIKKLSGQSLHLLQCNLTLGESTSMAAAAQLRRQCGPINLLFEIPMFNASGLQVRYLRILPPGSAASNRDYSPYRWVRYVTRSSSYIARI